ncbi:MAG: DUF2280 domain-containing protein [Fibrella sp.]|nr:DUF2280 domain-containing protein [Armatimonadota bacterium]
MADLTEDTKQYIITLLARMHPPHKIVDRVAEDLGVKVNAQQVCSYKPGTAAGGRMSDEHKTLFAAVRKRFLSDASEIPITHPNYRLQKLQDLLDDPISGRSPKTILATIELYQKIEGGMFTQKVAGATPEDMAAYGAHLTDQFISAVTTHVSNPEDRVNTLLAIARDIANETRRENGLEGRGG